MDTYYYQDTKTTFGESIDGSGVLSDIASAFKLNGGQKVFKAKAEQTKDLKLTNVSVNIYTGENYKEEVSKLSYDVASEEWNYISVPIGVTKKGKYVVDFYNQDDIYINSGYFEIK